MYNSQRKIKLALILDEASLSAAYVTQNTQI